MVNAVVVKWYKGNVTANDKICTCIMEFCTCIMEFSNNVVKGCEH